MKVVSKQWPRMSVYWPVCIVVAILMLFYIIFYFSTERHISVRNSEPVTYGRFGVNVFSKERSASSNNVTHLAFVGDMMFDRGVLLNIQKYAPTEDDYNFPLALVRDQLTKYDMTFGNLEGPVSERGYNRGSIYSFRMNPKTVAAIKDAGFDAVSVANNHIGDWGPVAMHDTLNLLSEAGIIAVGGGESRSEAYSPKYFHTDGGIVIAFIGASQFGKGYTEAPVQTGEVQKQKAPDDYSGVGIAVLDSKTENKELIESITQARQQADFVIVSLHFGDEYRSLPTDFQQKVAKSFIDTGADLIVGHHPHVLEPVEEYSGADHGGLIAYSLGNFVFDQYFSSSTMSSAILEVEIEKPEKDVPAKINAWHLLPIKINKYFQPYVVEDNG